MCSGFRAQPRLTRGGEMGAMHLQLPLMLGVQVCYKLNIMSCSPASILNPCVGTSQEHIRGNHNHVTTTTQVEKTQLWCFSSVAKKRSAIIHQPLSRWNTIPEPCVWFFDEPVHQQLPTVQAEHYGTCAPKSKFKVIQRNIYLHMQAKWSHCRALVHAHAHVCARICVHTAGGDI